MANMLRGKFRDRLRLYFRKKKRKNNIKETKYTKRTDTNVSLNKENNININVLSDELILEPRKTQVNNKIFLKGNLENNNDVNINKSINNSSKKNVLSIEQEVNDNSESKIKLLENEIVSKIIKIVEEYKNELDIISSDIYIISLNSKDIKTKEQCEEEQKQITKLLEKINKIKDDYKILKSKNFNTEYLEINDWTLVELIAYYKSILEFSSNTKNIENSLKKAEIFEQTNETLDMISSEIIKLEKSNQEKLNREKISIDRFNKIKNSMYDFDSECAKYNTFIKEQNNIMEDLEQKVGNISKNEQIKYKFIGYDKLLLNTLKYISLLLISPLKGAFPTIAISTLATKSTLELLSKEAYVEKIKNISFSVEDFTNMISFNLSSIDLMGSMIETSLKDIEEIKNKLKQVSFNSVSLEYNNFTNKLNDFEKILNGNKNKINKLKEKMNKNLIINKNAIIKVKRLNEHN